MTSLIIIPRESRRIRRSRSDILFKSIAFISVQVSTSVESALHITTSRVYPNECLKKPREYYDYDTCTMPPANVVSRKRDEFSLLRRLGSGKFSDVFEAVDGGSSRGEIRESKVDVFGTNEMTEVDPDQLCVIKCLKPVVDRKIKRELLVLSHASGLPNLARLRGCVIPDSYRTDATNIARKPTKEQISTFTNQMPSLVLEHAGPNSQWLCHRKSGDPSLLPNPLFNQQQQQQSISEAPSHLREYEMKYYLFHLLIALDALHSRGIMHRDVKPRNVLINRKWPPLLSEITQSMERKHHNIQPPSPLMLIDLGLADFYIPKQKYNVRVSSRHYKAPELLLGYGYYDFGIDMWGVGCILAGLLLRREPFFRGKDNLDQFGKIVSVLGKEDLLSYCNRVGLKMSGDLERVVQKYTAKSDTAGKRKDWFSFLKKPSVGKKKDNTGSDVELECPVPSARGLDLLDKLLVYDHQKRLTAVEAMAHSYFDEVRDLVQGEVRQRWNLEQRSIRRKSNSFPES